MRDGPDGTAAPHGRPDHLRLLAWHRGGDSFEVPAEMTLIAVAEPLRDTRQRFCLVQQVLGAGNADLVVVRVRREPHDVPEFANAAPGWLDRLDCVRCENDLLEILAAGRDLTQLRVSPTLPSESGPGNWTWDIIVPDGRTVFVALNTGLSLDRCRLSNPEDRASRYGPGPRYWIGFRPARGSAARPAKRR